jgi:hypothetical protein
VENNNYQIKRVCKENLKDLVFLFKSTRGRDIPLEYFEKKFDTSFTGCTYIGFFAYDTDNNPAAFCGVFPCIMNVNGAKIVAAQIADLITHIKHQRKGLFKILFKHTVELAKKENIKLLFTFPDHNNNSYKGFVHKLGLAHVENFENYQIPTSHLPILKIFTKLGYKHLHYRYIKFMISMMKQITSLQNSNTGSNFGYVHRDERFFKYKKYEESFLIESSGIKIWFKVDDGTMVIGDIELNNATIETYLKKLKQLCFWLGLRSITFYVSPDTFWSENLKNKYHPREGVAICHFNLDNSINIKNIKFNLGDGDTF